MSRDRNRRIRELMELAEALGREERESALLGETDGDRELVADVIRILESMERTRLRRGPTEVRGPSVFAESTGSFPRAFGEFELLSVLGSGGMGTVFRAHQASLSRTVALKVIAPILVLDEEIYDRFLREPKRTANLDHPNIARVHAAGVQDGVPWFAMEFIDGRDLHQEIQLARDEDGTRERILPATPKEWLRASALIVKQIADALTVAHGAGLVHRDVKPRNIMLTWNAVPKLVDFGIARDIRFGADTTRSDRVGAPSYMSPEQVDAALGAVDERTDIYSLGAVLYELLTLQRAYDGDSVQEILSQISRADPLPISKVRRDVSPALVAICEKAMARDRTQRFHTAAEFSHSLERYLAGEPIDLKPVPQWVRQLRRAMARKLSVVLALSVVVPLLAIVVFRESSRPDERAIRLDVIDWKSRVHLAGTLFARPIEMETGCPEESIEIGETPASSHSLTIGSWRFVFVREDGSVREFVRRIDGFKAEGGIDLMLRYHDVQLPSGDDVVRFEPVDGLRMPAGANGGCALQSKACSVEAFRLSKFEVSNREYMEFARETGEPMPYIMRHLDYDTDWDDLPVVGVSAESARAYCEWRGGRLPTHAEWELAARGMEGRRFPWGDADDRRGIVGVRSPAEIGRTPRDRYVAYLASVRPVRQLDAEVALDSRTASGILNLFGNVAEWVESEPMCPPGVDRSACEASRLVLGESWLFSDVGIVDLSLHSMDVSGANGGDASTGFRVAWSESVFSSR